MTSKLKRLLVACHPDRHGGDHSWMEQFFRVVKRNPNSKSFIARCRWPGCGVRVGANSRACRVHWRSVWATLLGCLLLTVAGAGELQLAWDASPTAGVTNYVLYATTNSFLFTSNALVRVSTGTNRTVRIEDLKPPGSTWRFAATAVAGGVESDFSNVLVAEVPVAPTNARVVAIQYGITLTNFSDAGFFRLRIPVP